MYCAGESRPDEDRLVADMIELARQYGRYGYRRIAALLRDAGWSVSDGRVERLGVSSKLREAISGMLSTVFGCMDRLLRTNQPSFPREPGPA